MVLPRLIHPINITISRQDVVDTYFDEDAREPIQQSARYYSVIIPGQVEWVDTVNDEASKAGLVEKASGYVLFRKLDLDAASFTVKINDRISQIGHEDTDLYIDRLEWCGHYPDQDGASLLKAFFADRGPSRLDRGPVGENDFPPGTPGPAHRHTASEIIYDPTKSDLDSENVQDALDEIVEGGAVVSYTNAEPIPITVGGWEVGSTFTGLSMQEMWDGLFYIYQYPAFTSFVISGQISPLEVGASIAVNRTFIWTTSNGTNVEANSISLVDVTGGSITIGTGLPNNGSRATSYPSSPITKNSSTTHSFRINGLNTKSQTFNRTYTVTWNWRRYYGESLTTPLSDVNVMSLRVSELASGFAGSYSFVGGGYKYISYPTSFGTATSFKNVENNFDVPFEAPYNVSITNAYGVVQLYRVHRTTNVLLGSMTISVS